MLLLALSAFQGRPMRAAAEALLALAPDGLQLTPGCAPDPDFVPWLRDLANARGLTIRTHHGFSPSALRAPVWDRSGVLLVDDDSVHPPRRDRDGGAAFDIATWAGATTLETMYGPYHLGDEAALNVAMDRALALALDVSHLWIQRCTTGLSDATWRRIQDYPHIAEIHVSANDGRRDQHRQLHAEVFGLAWARARATAGTPLVLESYFHRSTLDDQRRQVDLCRAT